ncbi:MAG TPA: hypothetical protein PLS50_00355 [Candidatus Dojkabacteria bacterium]|nr:hypothetical protein [Candidatus Dojkabacteria bacterium]
MSKLTFTSFIIALFVNLFAKLGEPFKYEAKSTLRHSSEIYLKKDFKSKRNEHYGERFALASFILIIFLVAAGLSFISYGIFPIVIIAFVVIVDIVMLIGRGAYALVLQEEVKEAGSNELVTLDSLKDTSLQSILNKRNEQIEEYKKTYFERTGKYPSTYEIENSGH